MEKVKAVFCDLGRVVLRFKDRFENLCGIASSFCPGDREACRLALGRELRAIGAISSASGEDLFEPVDTGKVALGRVYGAFLRALHFASGDMPAERFWPLYFAHLEVIPETCAVISEVRQAGVPVVAATNGDSWYPADLVRHHGGIAWDGTVMSWLVGCKKPEGRFFDVCLRAANSALGACGSVQFGGCLLVDDMESHVDAFSSGFGGQTICFDATKQPASELREAFVRFGVLPA